MLSRLSIIRRLPREAAASVSLTWLQPRQLSSMRATPFLSILDRVKHSIQDYESAGLSQADLATPIADVSRSVFANNEVAMADINVVGFDYDYTLANYTDRLPKLIYQLAQNHLVNTLRYPEGFLKKDFDPDFAIRGLSIDTRTGWLMKVDSFNSITLNTVFRGTERVPRAEVMAQYADTRHVPVDYRASHMRGLVDLFSISEACLLAHIHQFLLDGKYDINPAVVVEDVANSIAHVHISGEMHRAVQEKPHVYLEADPELRMTLRGLKKDGKKTFVLTNSGYEYIAHGLRFLLGDDWRSYFDVVIVNANKPSWYKQSRPFRELDPSNNRYQWAKVQQFEPGKTYVEGNVLDFMRMTGWRGRQVLYMGDNLFSDWMSPRSNHGWTTGGIIRELETHITVQDSLNGRAVEARLHAVGELLRLLQQAEEVLAKQQYFERYGIEEDESGSWAVVADHDKGEEGGMEDISQPIADSVPPAIPTNHIRTADARQQLSMLLTTLCQWTKGSQQTMALSLLQTLYYSGHVHVLDRDRRSAGASAARTQSLTGRSTTNAGSGGASETDLPLTERSSANDTPFDFESLTAQDAPLLELGSLRTALSERALSQLTRSLCTPMSPSTSKTLEQICVGLHESSPTAVSDGDSAADGAVAGGGSGGSGGGCGPGVPYEDVSQTVLREQLATVLNELECLREILRHQNNVLYNQNFGNMFRSETSPTLFAFSMMRYVDLYTSRVTNLLRYSPNHRFYPHTNALPHQRHRRRHPFTPA